MKKYLKNKSFIPYSFYEKKQELNKKDEKIIFSIFVVLNILLLPMNICRAHEFNNKKMESFKEESYSDIEQISIKTISNLVNSVDYFDVEEAEINNKGGRVRISSLDDLKKIEDDNYVTISNTVLIDGENNEYEVSLKVNER